MRLPLDRLSAKMLALVWWTLLWRSFSDVVGGGSAGMSGATNILENGGGVVLLDKSFCFGGNSTKLPAKKCREQELSEIKARRIPRILHGVIF